MTTFRGAFRAAFITALVDAETAAGASVFPEYDWPTGFPSEPVISVTARRWRNEDRSNGIGVPQFWSTIWLGVECRAAQNDQDGAGRALLVDQLDTLSDLVERVAAAFIIRDGSFGQTPPQLFRRITATEGQMQIDASGAAHQGSLDLGFGFEYANDAEAEITACLEKIVVSMIRRARFGERFGRAYVRTIAQFVVDEATLSQLF